MAVRRQLLSLSHSCLVRTRRAATQQLHRRQCSRIATVTIRRTLTIPVLSIMVMMPGNASEWVMSRKDADLNRSNFFYDTSRIKPKDPGLYLLYAVCNNIWVFFGILDVGLLVRNAEARRLKFCLGRGCGIRLLMN